MTHRLRPMPLNLARASIAAEAIFDNDLHPQSSNLTIAERGSFWSAIWWGVVQRGHMDDCGALRPDPDCEGVPEHLRGGVSFGDSRVDPGWACTFLRIASKATQKEGCTTDSSAFWRLS